MNPIFNKTMDTTKPQTGSWNTIQAYPEKIKFESEVPVEVTFPEGFTEPLEMPNKDGTGVFYIFNVTSDGKAKAINTSSWTLMKSLKGQEPLAGKTVVITKKNVAGKNMFYCENKETMFIPDSDVSVETVKM